MAVNLHKYMQEAHNTPLHVWNRTATAHGVIELAALGATVHPSLQSLVGAVNVLFLMLTNDAAVVQVADDIIAANQSLSQQQQLIVLNASTILPGTSDDVGQKFAAAKIAYAATPVFGRPDAARSKGLVVVFGGAQEVRAQVEEFLKAIGRALLSAGETAAKANVFKLSGNFMIVSLIEQLAEGLYVQRTIRLPLFFKKDFFFLCSTLAEKNGIDRKDFYAFIEAFFPLPSYKAYGEQIAKDTYLPAGFPVQIALKDVGHMRHLAESSQTPLPILDIVWDHLQTANKNGYGQHVRVEKQDYFLKKFFFFTQDWASLATTVRHNAGIESQKP